MIRIRRSAARHHPLAVAYAALFIALGGTAYAAAFITGEEIVDESVTGADIRNATLTGDDVQDTGLSGDDILDGSLAADEIARFGIDSLRLADGAVISRTLGANSVSGAKVVDNSLTGADVAESQLGAVPSALNAGKLGGLTPGEFWKNGYALKVVTTPITSSGAGGRASCPSNLDIISGGAEVRGETGGKVALAASRPVYGSTGSGWVARAVETSPTNAQYQLHVFAICADTPVPFGAAF